MNLMTPSECWYELITTEDLQQFMDLVGCFHDGCIREIHVDSGHYVAENLSMTVGGKTTAHMLVQRQFRAPSAVELYFDNVVRLAVNPPPLGYDAIIYEATFCLREQVFYWAESKEWDTDSRNRDDFTWIAARRVWWRDASEWMGPDLRYRTGPPVADANER